MVVNAEQRRPSGLLYSIISRTQTVLTSYLDTVLPPSRREVYKFYILDFASRRPFFATFLFAQLIFSGTPLLIFALFSVGVLLSSLAIALGLAVICALAFALVFVGFAGLVLGLVLFLTVFSASAVWLAGWSVWFTLRLFGIFDHGHEKREEGSTGSKAQNKSWDGKWEEELKKSSDIVTKTAQDERAGVDDSANSVPSGNVVK